MRKRPLLRSLCLLCVLFLLTTAIQAGNAPSLYWNDEAWYRDALSPLTERDGKCCIPAELCGMFDEISVSTPKSDNVLLCNRETGDYLSVLVNRGSAAVRGEICDITVFREGGTVYLEAEKTAEALGLTAEYLTVDGETFLRLTDGDERFDFTYLLEMKSTDEDAEDVFAPTEDETKKTVFFLCEPDRGLSFSVCEACEQYGMAYTCFLDGQANIEEQMTALSQGEYGLLPNEVTREACDSLNETLSLSTHRKVHAVLALSFDGDRDEMKRAGYAVISPDFAVTNGSYARGTVDEILGFLEENDRVYVSLERGWSATEVIRLLAELDGTYLKTANLAG